MQPRSADRRAPVDCFGGDWSEDAGAPIIPSCPPTRRRPRQSVRMPTRPWWKRWDGLPWDDQPDADERQAFLRRFLMPHVAILVITPLVVTFGFAASLAAKRAWPAALIWMVIGILLSYGSLHLWRALRDSSRR